MNKIKEQFKKDFEESNKKVELTFDVSQLIPNAEPEVSFEEVKRKKSKKRKIIIISCVSSAAVLTLVAIPLLQNIKVHSSVTTRKRAISANAIAIAESNTFKKINNVKFPENERPFEKQLSDSEMNAYNNFTNRTYHAVVDTSNNDNMSYAAVGLYSLMNEMYGSISREELKNDFDNLLGLNENSRKKFYEYVMLANSFVSENCTTQLKNSAFFNTEFNYSQEFVNKLTDLYCQAYTIDFKTEADKMVEWVNKAVNSDGFIDKSFLKMSQYTQLYFFSTLYFKNAWAHKYLSENNVDDEFYLSNGSTITTKYMSHSYTTDCYYDYGSYISFKDYYLTGVGSITYLIPKDTSDDIYALTRNVNIFDEKDTNKVVFKRDPYSDYTSPFVVNLKTPKFKVTAEIDFKNSLSNLGFGDMFDDHFDSFHNAFDDPAASTLNFYLEQAKQKNEVEFNEDGTVIKSISMGSYAERDVSVGPMGEELNIDLNQPFIYIIRDCNEVPILVGHVDNPKY